MTPRSIGFKARPDRALIRANHRSERFVLAELVAPPAGQRVERRPVNLCFVLDRSGSMSGSKIALARQAVESALARLRPDDRFSIVVYDEEIELVMESTPASHEARTAAMDRLRHIDARGSTDLAAGWLRGCEQVALHLEGYGVNRALLLTDGLANVGITDGSELERHARQLRDRGVTTSTFGVGEEFDERLLQSLADSGGGHFYYIAGAAQIEDHITAEVGETLEVVVRGVTIEVTTPDGLDAETLSPFRGDRRDNRLRVLLGDLVADQHQSIVLRFRFPRGAAGETSGVLLALTHTDAVAGGDVGGVPGTRDLLVPEPIALSWTYADDPANDAQERDAGVDRAVAELFAARARQEAVALNRAGQFVAARASLGAVAQRLRGYAGTDPRMVALLDELEVDEQTWAAPAAEGARKQTFAASAYAMRGRAPDGRASRRS